MLTVTFKTFTTVLSLDTSRDPAHVYVLFGKTLFENKGDLRSTYGELYLQRSDGKTWTDPVLVSEPGTTENWYPNMNEDVSRGIGVVYLKGSGRTQTGKPPLDIIFASTGAPGRTSSGISITVAVTRAGTSAESIASAVP